MCLCSSLSWAQQAAVKKDSILVKKDTIPLKFNFKHGQKGGIFLNNGAEQRVIYDRVLNKYVIVEKIGDYYVRTPIFMTPKEYQEYRLQRDMLEYFKEKVAATSKRKGSEKNRKDLLPSYYVNSEFFESVFGGNKVEFTPTGSVNVRLGFIYQNIDNPQLSQENRSNFTFDFNQQVSAGLQAKVGERLKFTANYDTQSTFDFQNLIKLEYTPNEDNIIQGIEAGNVTMPIKNSLINGAQSLFGVKTKLQFGKTNITAVFSQQNSDSKVVTAEGGSSIQEFELRTTDYDTDRHFFLSHYFRDNYANALRNSPLISSPINITRVEVWITNRNASVEDFRNIVAFADIGESNPNVLVNSNVDPVSPPSVNGISIPANEANEINNLLTENDGNGRIRSVATVNSALESDFNMQEGTDYSLLQNARKLQPNEYTLHPQLGYISLNRRLNDGEILAVAYEYTVVGASSEETSFKVGEFSNDGITAPANLAVKLLRSEILQTKRTRNGEEEAFPTWRLMMKNVYALGAFPLSQDGFRLEVQYRDDQTGIPSNVLQNAQTNGVATTPLIQLFDLDRLDQAQFQSPDGFFDYLENITVNSQNGYIIFPHPEPFGEGLEPILTNPQDELFLFNDLYLETKIQAKNNHQDRDKYILKGYFKSQNSGGISIGAFNVPRGSVTVTAGGRQLVEGVDYVVDYQLGRVQIIDPGLQSSGTPIQISTENNAVFNQQRKTFMGIDVEHRFSEDFIIGGTILNVNERPLTPKINFGNEPINNTMLGFNLDYSTEMPLFTKWANKLPFVDTDAPSNLSIRADMAYLLPGSPSGIDVTGEATAYVDDFEASQIPISLLNPQEWYMASTPRDSSIDLGGNIEDDLSYNDQRARLAWYNIDQIFYGVGAKPSNIDADELSRAETRQVNFGELFPNQQLDVTQNALVRTFDLAFYPNERGPYNFDANVDSDGLFDDPQNRWGGVMTSLNTNNFDQANVEYIQFWIMDPYQNYSITNEEGLPTGVNPQDLANQVGDLFFNLGNISEDILRDNRKMYENGLPIDGSETNVEGTIWGNVPSNPSILYAFDDSDTSRANQDLGLDGLNDEDEGDEFPDLGLDDPASDNFQFFRGSNLDAQNASILTRYKLFNNPQGNSPTANQSTESYPTSSTVYPDVEDINKDQTMNTVESYYEYRVSLNRNDLVVGRNFIVDEKETEVILENGSTQSIKWYQFRVPIRSGIAINEISDFNSIRFMRMYLTNFRIPVVLRFGELSLVRGDWRRYTRTLDPAVVPDQELTQDEINDFEVGVVNIEQNEERYVLPPGIERERLQGSTTVQQQNEQSVSLTVRNLPQNKVRAIYKNISIDLRRYKILKMFTHLEALPTQSLSNGDMVGIIRLGTDLNDNFYQIEIPLNVSANGSLNPLEVWPEVNNLDLDLESLGKLKLDRDAVGEPINQLYPASTGGSGFAVRVKGNPTLAQIRTVMLGIRNDSPDLANAEVWFNELRAAGFDNEGGWAAVVSTDANFADVANVSMTGSVQTIGFGNVEDRVSQRSLDETKQYDITTSVNIGKMMPKKWNVQLPMNYSIGEKFIDPKFDPQYQDVELSEAAQSNPNSQFSRDYTKRKSISFVNVKKNRSPNSDKKPKFYDVENVSVSYAYNEEFRRNYNIERYVNQNVTASASYNHTFQSKYIEPFKNSNSLRGKYWQFIKDINFNPVPKNIAVNTRINRNFNQQASRNLIEGLSPQPVLTQRRFLFDWDYTVGLALTKSLQVNFNATNSYIYDSFGQDEDLEIFDEFFSVGRPNNYHQKLNATYKIPIDKFPFLKFVTANYAYTADFDWRASSQSIVDQVGNVIQNANTHNINTNFNFARFYKDIGLEDLFIKKNPKEKGLPNTPRSKQVNSKKKEKIGRKIAKGFYDILTSVKTGKISYSENNGTFLPGYVPEIGFLGRDNIGGSFAPTLGFVFGSQVDIRQKALTNGWLVTRTPGEDYVNLTYSKTHYDKLDYNFSVRPVNDLNIEITGNRISTENLSQQIDAESGSAQFENTPFFQTGNFSTSFSMIGTAFKDTDALFETFKGYRTIIANRLSSETGLPVSGFGQASQQVILPAFLAAYSGKSPDKISTGIFRNVPVPNWNLRYTGLMKFKWFQKNFSNFAVTHGYKSSYTVANFTNNLQYEPGNPPTNVNASGNYQPELLISSVSLIDEFSPLVRVDMNMKNSFSFRGEIRTDRTLTLNFNNNTLTDIKGTEFVFGLGYVFKDVKMTTRFTGKKEVLKGDINLRADVSLRDNLTLIRAIDEDNNQVSGGEKLFSFKFTADYRLNSNLTASFYYNHQASRYAISTTFPRQAINGGFNIIYNLGN